MKTAPYIAAVMFLALAGMAHGVEKTLKERVSATVKAFQQIVEWATSEEATACTSVQASKRAVETACRNDFASYRELERIALEKNMFWQFAAERQAPDVAVFEREFWDAFAKSGEKLAELRRNYPKPNSTER